MRRREFIVVGSAMLAQPFAALAQQPERVWRIAVLQDYAADDLEGQAQLAAFREALRKLGWTENKNMHIDYRAAAVDADQVRTYAAELAAMHPDVVLAAGGTLVAAVQRASQSVPIVFVNATDPVGSGLVASLSRPGGNATGFTQFEFGISAKWLELLKELAPGNSAGRCHS